MDKIFHVFVSSTYKDLIQERKKVSEAVAKSGSVPEGMEIFPASSQSQMDFIKSVIDRCDFYIVIVGGTYGSESNGISYTEMEFEYALEKGLPILAFLHNSPTQIIAEFVDTDPEKIKKLESFKTRLTEDAVVDHWNSDDHLATLSLAALMQAKTAHPGVGWIRADAAAEVDILNEINVLRKDNESLKEQVQSLQTTPDIGEINLASLDDEFTIHYDHKSRPRNGRSIIEKKSFDLSWREIVKIIGPEYRMRASIHGIESSMTEYLKLNLETTGSVFIE